ncbi:hypothetical protein F5884DRAFT_624443, partial [Xylogone sp. PMI_703]
FWIAKKNGSLARLVMELAAYHHLEEIYEREHKRLELQARNGLHTRRTTASSFVAPRPWTDRTKWDITYDQLRQDILRNLTAMPSCHTDYLLEQGVNSDKSDLLSPRTNEQKLVKLAVVIRRMFEHCKETARRIPRTLLCWLRSTGSKCYPKPFTLVSLETSRTKYARLFQRFIIFLFRSYCMPHAIRRRACGIRFTKEQREQLKSIWEHPALNDGNLSRDSYPPKAVEQSWRKDGDVEEAVREDAEESSDDDMSDEEDDPDYVIEVDTGNEMDCDKGEEDGEDEDESYGQMLEVDNSPAGHLLELVFKLSITFSTEQFTDGDPSSSLLVFFSGILGFSNDGENFLPAKSYTPYLSGLIYDERLLFFGLASPPCIFPHSGIPPGPRLGRYEQLDEIRRKYMVTGSQSPLEEFQSLRDFGRVIARTDPPSFLLHWSDDGETVYFGDEFSLTMESYRGLAEYFISRAEGLCTELMLGLDVVVDLTKIKDDMTETRNGYSFVYHPDNGLSHAYLDLAKQACTTRGGLFKNGQWDWKAIFPYQKKAEMLDEMCLGALRTACGQDLRGPDLLELECENAA